MGQKINPIANRLGIIRGWDSNWFGGSNFGKNILEDSKIREYLDARFKSYIEKPGRGNASKKEYTSVYEYISRTVIERTPKLVTITICTSRPGMIIGQGGKDVEALIKFCKFAPSKVNLIEYTPMDGGDFQQADPKVLTLYQTMLEAAGGRG